MQDYKTIDKTGWFIEKLRSGWFSRREVVQLAVTEFPGISEKTLDGTIGQYWSDSTNPKWSTWKAIRARGLKVVESAGRRRIVEDPFSSIAIDADFTDSTPMMRAAHTSGNLANESEAQSIPVRQPLAFFGIVMIARCGDMRWIAIQRGRLAPSQ